MNPVARSRIRSKNWKKSRPRWRTRSRICRVSRRIMCYRKADGSTGYEIDSYLKRVEVSEGDTIIEGREYVKVIKKSSGKNSHKA